MRAPFTAALFAACAAACATPDAVREPVQAAAPPAAVPADAPVAVEAPRTITPTPWTSRFTAGATVVADHVRIEGPDGLLEHLVVSSDDGYFDRRVTHADGKLTQITTRIGPEVPEIRAYLDKWTFAAFESVTVVEHLPTPDAAPIPVTVVATGGASFRDLNGALEERETLRWTGTIGE